MIQIVFIVAMSLVTIASTADQGGCSCAVFPENSTNAIIECSLQYEVNCDEEGDVICRNLCVVLAESAKDKAPAMICEKLNRHVENLKVAVFSKACNKNEDQWKFTGLKIPEPICCHEGKETECDS